MQYLLSNPLLYFIGVLVLLFGLLFLKRLRWYFALPLLIILLLNYLTLTPKGANFMLATLVDQQNYNCTFNTALIVADNPTRTPMHKRDFSALQTQTLQQLNAATEWLLETDNRSIIVSGRNGFVSGPGAAKLAYNYFAMAGIEASRVTQNNSDVSLYDSARTLFEANANKDLILFVSPINQNRAVNTFSKLSFNVCPKTMDTLSIRTNFILSLLPSGEAISLTESVLMEYLTSLWYWWTDKI